MLFGPLTSGVGRGESNRLTLIPLIVLGALYLYLSVVMPAPILTILSGAADIVNLR